MNGNQTAAPATTARLIHASLAAGVLLFGAGVYFALRPNLASAAAPPAALISALIGFSVVACASSLVMLRRVPRRSTDESANLFWTRATTPALVTWALVEGGSLMAIVAYVLSGSVAALAVAGVGLAGLIALNPRYIERT
jgi:hypothetical protein